MNTINPLYISTIGLLLPFHSCWEFIPVLVFVEWTMFNFISQEIALLLLSFLKKLENLIEEMEDDEKEAAKMDKLKK